MTIALGDLPPPYGPPVVADPPCEVCGRAPSMYIDARMYTGLGIIGRTTFWKGYACRDCAISQYRAGLTHCLWAGWWGIAPLFVNPFVILRNARGLVAAHRLGEPACASVWAPLEPGRPVLARPRAWVGILLPLLLVVGTLVGVFLTTGGADELAVGECVNLPPGTSFADAEVVSCGGPHTAEVTGSRPARDAATTERLCQPELIAYLGGTKGADNYRPDAVQRLEDGEPVRVICLIVDADGRNIVGPARGSGR